MSPSVRAGGHEMLVKAQLAQASEELGGRWRCVGALQQGMMEPVRWKCCDAEV